MGSHRRTLWLQIRQPHWDVLLRILDLIARNVAEDEGDGDVPARAEQAATRLVGFEHETGPFSVAQLRLAEEYERRGANVAP